MAGESNTGGSNASGNAATQGSTAHAVNANSHAQQTSTQGASGAAAAASTGVAPGANGASPAAAARPAGDASRLAALARRERAIQSEKLAAKQWAEAEQARLKAERAELEARRADVERWQNLPQLAKQDPLKALEALGLSYDAVAEAQLNGGKLPPERVAALEAEKVEQRLRTEHEKTQAELTKLREEREADRKRAEDAARQQAEAGLQQFRDNTIAYVKSQADKYEILTAIHREFEVPQVIEAHYQQSLQADMAAARREGREPVGKILSADEAAQLVEQFYEENAESIYSTKKMQAKYKKLEQQVQQGNNPQAQQGVSPAAAAPAQNGSTQATVSGVQRGVTFSRYSPGQRPTLSNRDVASPSGPMTAAQSEAERVKRALDAMARVEAETRARRAQA